MVTVRQIEKLWEGRKYEQLLAGLLATRVEGALLEELKTAGSLAAAAMGMIRLDELNQTHVPLFSKFVRAILAAQQNDGGWHEIAPTALCLRALMIDEGRGEAINRGLTWLSQLQQPAGIWPRVPLRRMPADPEVSAFVLLELGQQAIFHEQVRVDEALSWFENNEESLSDNAKTLWAHAKLRCRVRVETAMVDSGPGQAWMWS